jgi:cell shape-determining protein MreC
MGTIEPRKNNFLKGLNICLLFAIVISGFYYLKSIDDLVNKNFELQSLKDKSTLLEEENKNFEIMKSELESYESMSARIDDLKMVKVSGVSYINAGDDSLAKK